MHLSASSSHLIAPADAEVTINTGEMCPEKSAQEIILRLEREGCIRVSGTTA